ncbi:MAG: hypothetical protein U0229_21240 [Anaeromyxobacter sp.]|mgnify:FL=1
MILAVLRAASPSVDLPALLAAHPSVEPDTVWRKGDRDLRGEPEEASGFSLLVSQDLPWEETLEATHARLAELAPLLAELRRAGADLWVDFGMMVGALDAYAVAVAFSPEDMSRLAALGVAVVVSAYPVSEDSAPEGAS